MNTRQSSSRLGCEDDQLLANHSSTGSTCILIMLAALALVGGRIAVVRSATGEVPFLSANDRSRWATVASLVDYGTYKIDHFQAVRDPQTNRRTWQSIDRVRHVSPDGKIHDYSSKPPLLATMVAGLYWVIKTATGLNIQSHTFYVARIILALVNLPLLAIMFACTYSLVKRYAQTSFTKIYLVTAASLGTLLTSFSISLNNHLPAAVASVVVLWMLDSQARSRTSYFKMLLAGAAAAFSVANELPSLAILPLWGLVSLRISFGKTLLGFVPGILLVAGAFFATNWWAHQSLRPPYAHRGVGNLLDSVELDAVDLTRSTPRDSLQVAQDHRAAIAEILHCEEERLSIERARSDRWLRATIAEGRNEKRFFAIVVTDTRIEIREWDDWYDYPGTYWVEGKLTGVDKGEANRMIYAVHTLIGHHGIFSLSPIWLLSLAGVWFWISRRRDYVSAVPVGAPMRDFPWISVVIISLVSLVCLFFYLSRPQIDRNYGGVSSGLRWMFWMAPLWIFLAIAAVDKLAVSRLGRIVCGVFLAGSCFTVSTSLDNPWTHPWIYRLMEFLGLPL